MAGEVGMGATTGGLQMGAAGGALGAGLVAAGIVSGPVGWAILGAGAIAGSLMGGFGGSKAKKSRKYAKKAAAIQQQREQNEVGAQYLQMIRQGRITRAASQAGSSTAGISTSSLATSALSSIGSQLGYNIGYLAEDRRLYSLYSSYMKKAGKAAQAYQNTLALQSGISGLMTSIGSTAKSIAGPKKITPWPGGETTQQTAQQAGPYPDYVSDITVESLPPI